jgi:pimeloyl-ACP methyl ester carboxylesterase
VTRADVQQFASFDGLSISFSVQGAGPDVLLMHGFAASADRNWFAPGIADALLASGRRVIAYDARGHGASGKPHDPAAYGNGAMVRDAQALLDHVGVTTVDVVGYSMGALMASRLVPVEPRSRSLVLGGIGGRLVGRRGLDRPRIAAALEARAGTRINDPNARAFRVFAQRSGNDLRALAAVQRAAQHGASGVLAKIAVPTMVVAGANDRLAGSPQELAARITGAVGVVVPGDHLSAVGKPELTREIVGFLARVSPV